MLLRKKLRKMKTFSFSLGFKSRLPCKKELAGKQKLSQNENKLIDSVAH